MHSYHVFFFKLNRPLYSITGWYINFTINQARRTNSTNTIRYVFAASQNQTKKPVTPTKYNWHEIKTSINNEIGTEDQRNAKPQKKKQRITRSHPGIHAKIRPSGAADRYTNPPFHAETIRMKCAPFGRNVGRGVGVKTGRHSTRWSPCVRRPGDKQFHSRRQ